MIRVGKLQAALALVLVVSLGAEAWCLNESYRAPERAIDCVELLTIPEGRYTLTEPCPEHWELGGGDMGRGWARLSFLTSAVEGAISSRTPYPNVLRMRTRHDGAVHAVRHLRREDTTMLRYVERHPNSVWPIDMPLDVDRVRDTLLLSDPPLPVRDTTIFFPLLAIVSLLSLLLIAWLKRRWTPRPRAF